MIQHALLNDLQTVILNLGHRHIHDLLADEILHDVLLDLGHRHAPDMLHDLVLDALQRNKLNDLQDFLQDQGHSKIHNLLHDSWMHALRRTLSHIPVNSCRSIVAAMKEPAFAAQHVRTCCVPKASGHTCWAARVALIQTHRRCESHWLKTDRRATRSPIKPIRTTRKARRRR